jgi:uncharacterized membrane protein
MHIIIFNISWMALNISLALIANIFAWFMSESKPGFRKYLYGLIWILFLPNTIYILTDVIHIFKDWTNVSLLYKPILLIEYSVLLLTGIATFIFAMYPFDRMLRKEKKKSKIIEDELLIIMINVLVAFGMVLGRVQRLNSWDVFFNLPQVIRDTTQVFFTPYLLLLFLFFGLLCNSIYFLFRNSLQQYEKQFFRK